MFAVLTIWMVLLVAMVLFSLVEDRSGEVDATDVADPPGVVRERARRAA